MSELCSCQISDRCSFEQAVKLVVENIPEGTNDKELFLNAAKAHEKIAGLRVKAEEGCCKNFYEVNPGYPGKKLL